MIRNIVLIFLIACLFSCKESPECYQNYTSGNAFGTTFSIQFIDKKEIDLSKSYDSIVDVINSSMSTYQSDSDISQINKGDITITVDAHFRNVFNVSKQIYTETKGVFDPTVGILVNAWDFGPEGKVITLDSLKVDSLLTSVGLDKVTLHQDKIIKQEAETFIDFNALAKGYAVDVFAEFLELKGVENYLIEIGGEIRGKGSNIIKQKAWKIGVEDPNFDETQSYSKVVSLYNEAMATSGSYRKFKLDEQGNRYAHIIDTETGYPHKSNLLSVSVIAKTCMQADAYATAFMAMDLEESKIVLENKKDVLEAYIIFLDKDGNTKEFVTPGFKKMVKK